MYPHPALPLTQRVATMVAIALGRATRVAVRASGRGRGTAFPGLIAGRVAPELLDRALSSIRDGLVVVSGSSGKSTTTKVLVSILRAHGLRVFTNSSTANIRQGLLSDMLRDLGPAGYLRSDIAVLEMDEAHGAKILKHVRPTTAVLTNVGTDQIDRFNDPQLVASLLGVVARSATEHVVMNADDGLLETVAATLDPDKVRRFGVCQEVLGAMPHGLGTTSTIHRHVFTGTMVEAMGVSTATIRHNGEVFDVALPSRGAHYAIDVAASIAAAAAILGTRFRSELVVEALRTPAPVFGRNEVVTVKGQQVELVLFQNPASFQLAVDYLPRTTSRLMVAVGSDVRDFSYLWPVDTSSLVHVDVVSGTLAEELALQLTYRDVQVDQVDGDLGRALDRFMHLPEPAVGVRTIMFTADAMRKTRHLLGLS